MVIHDSDGLHESVADRAAAEFESALTHVLAHGIGNRGSCGQVCQGAGFVHHGFSAGESPDIFIERAEFLLDFREPARVVDGGLDLQAVAHDAGVPHQSLNFLLFESRDLARIKSGKRLAEVFALFEDDEPAQARLKTFQHEKFKELPVVMHRTAPFLIVVLDIQRVLQTPGTADFFRSLLRFFDGHDRF